MPRPCHTEIRTELQPGLRDLDGFSHLHLITHLHRAAPGGLQVVPFLDETVRGIFATRSPRHPNPIGLSIVRLVDITGSTLEISGVDLLDGTPVLDIKPYMPTVDCVSTERTGWLENAAESAFITSKPTGASRSRPIVARRHDSFSERESTGT